MLYAPYFLVELSYFFYNLILLIIPDRFTDSLSVLNILAQTSKRSLHLLNCILTRTHTSLPE